MRNWGWDRLPPVLYMGELILVSYPMQDPEGDSVVPYIRCRPHPRNTELVYWDWEEDKVGRHHHEHVEHPESTTVHVIGIRILVAMSSGHHLFNFDMYSLFCILELGKVCACQILQVAMGQLSFFKSNLSYRWLPRPFFNDSFFTTTYVPRHPPLLSFCYPGPSGPLWHGCLSLSGSLADSSSSWYG